MSSKSSSQWSETFLGRRGGSLDNLTRPSSLTSHSFLQENVVFPLLIKDLSPFCFGPSTLLLLFLVHSFMATRKGSSSQSLKNLFTMDELRRVWNARHGGGGIRSIIGLEHDLINVDDFELSSEKPTFSTLKVI